MSFPFKDPLFNAQWLRTAGHAYAGGADLGECLAAARGIREPSPDSWRDAWLAMADRVAGAAEVSLAAGRYLSAHGGFLRASNYYRSAYIFLFGPGPDPRLVDAYCRQRVAFQQAISARPGWGEAIDIPFEGKILHGYFFAAQGHSPRPTLIMTGGYDSTAEEAYFFSGAAALARGYNFVCFDGPGQGAALIEDGMAFRPDWETVVSAVLDRVNERSEVDPARVALMGMSFGGYLAPRAATGNPSLSACIADPGQYSLLEEAQTRLPRALARQLPDGSPLMLEAIDALIRLRINHPTKGWTIRRCMWVHGVNRPIDYLRLTAQYTLEGRIERIRCPTLIASAEGDAIGATAGKLFEKLTCPKVFQRFSTAEGAGSHCESGARALFNQRAFDWLDPVLAAGAATAQDREEPHRRNRK
jgi:alpha-beta hydrolase superfamily lysophospholipase